MPLAPGTRLGAYEILSLIGSGGMGEVYRARDPRLGRDVAIKVLPISTADDPATLDRFEREARAIAALSHQNILAIHDVGTTKPPFIVTEHLEGETLRALIGRGPLPPARAVDVLLQLTSGLSAAHGRGIVHRDLKPDNVFLTRDGVVKILDFGLAKTTSALATADDVTRALDTIPGTLVGTCRQSSYVGWQLIHAPTSSRSARSCTSS